MSDFEPQRIGSGSIVQMLPAEPGWTVKMPYSDENGNDVGYTLYPVMFWAIAVTACWGPAERIDNGESDNTDQAIVPVFWTPHDGLTSTADSDCPLGWELLAPERINQLVEDHDKTLR